MFKIIKIISCLLIFICSEIHPAARWSEEENGVKTAFLEAKKNLSDIENQIKLYQKGIESAQKNFNDNSEQNKKGIECRLNDMQQSLASLIAQRNKLTPLLNNQNNILDIDLDF